MKNLKSIIKKLQRALGVELYKYEGDPPADTTTEAPSPNKPTETTTPPAPPEANVCGWTEDELIKATIILEAYTNKTNGRGLVALAMRNRVTGPGSKACNKGPVNKEIENIDKTGWLKECFRKFQFSIWNGTINLTGKDLCKKLLEVMKRLRGCGINIGRGTQAEIKKALKSEPNPGPLSATGEAFLTAKLSSELAKKEHRMNSLTTADLAQLAKLCANNFTFYANPDKITSEYETATIIQNNGDTPDGGIKVIRIKGTDKVDGGNGTYPTLWAEGVRGVILFKDGSHIFAIYICRNGRFYHGCRKSCDSGLSSADLKFMEDKVMKLITEPEEKKDTETKETPNKDE